ncbi:MAG: hypothetical protein V4671_12240 [Armatimonadota bacterium]
MTTPSTLSTPLPVTDGPRFHFFGYYDKSPWDVSGRFLLAQETGFMDRRPGPEDVADIGVVDTQDGNSWRKLSETQAWNWQQGCMLQWVPGSEDEIIFNVRQGDRFQAQVLNTRTNEMRHLSQPIYGVSPAGREAISLNFSRLFDVRPGYGYAGAPDPWADNICPEDDGLYHVDLETGDSRLIFSLADALRLGEPQPGMETGKHRFNHVQWNTDGTRFAVLHRWSIVPSPANWSSWATRLLTLNADGTDPHVLSDHTMISHYDWRDPQTVLAWARRHDVGDRYFLFTDKTPETTIVGDGILTVDGHCSYSPDRRWILTDTYPDKEGYRTLLLFDPKSERRIDIGRFHGPTPSDGEIRCDLHPRWSRDGRQICIDSIHENGHRQIYTIDVSSITTA